MVVKFCPILTLFPLWRCQDKTIFSHRENFLYFAGNSLGGSPNYFPSPSFPRPLTVPLQLRLFVCLLSAERTSFHP